MNLQGDVKRHLDLKHSNQLAYKFVEDNGVENTPLKLDSSLKRHTTFLRRLKLNLGAENVDNNIKDIHQLSLSKHLEEIVTNIVEGVIKCKSEKDSWAAVETISALHQRFPISFSSPLISLLSSSLSPPSKSQLAALSPEQRDKEEAARINKQRPILRVAGELYLVGLIPDSPSKDGPKNWLFVKLKDLLATDKDHSNTPILISFIKHFSALIYGLDGDQHTLIDSPSQERFKALSSAYYDTLTRKLVKEHLKLQDQDKRNHEAYIRSGEIFQDRQQSYEKLTKAYEKLLNSTQTLSELLHLDMPQLPKEQSKGLGGLVVADGSTPYNRDHDEYDSTIGKWEDEDAKNFYEDVFDLADVLPPAVFANVLGKKVDQKDDIGESPAQKIQTDEQMDKEKEQLVSTLTSTPDDPDEGISAGPSAQLNALFARLPEMNNRAMIDQVAVEFAMLNSKAARKRAIKSIAAVPRNRSDVLPYYARLTAILNKHMPDIGKGVVDLLDDEFRYLQRKKNLVKELAESRTKNARFISELTKFSVVPTHYILHCYKVLLDDFTGVNIDVLAILLETCGRYLLRSEETGEKMKIFLELMKRKQQLQHLDQRQQLILENAYYHCNPPERASRPVKERTPTELFIRHLIYDVLTRRTVEKVSKLLRKLHWEDEGVINVLLNVFTKVWKISYASIPLLAILVYDLQRFHPAFCVMVVDRVLEDVKSGVEQNIFKYNQRRVAAVRYLGELYNYRSVQSGVIFDVLWMLVTWGHVGGRPLPGMASGGVRDAPDDFFRIRLVCTLLDTCGACFDSGLQRKRLDDYIAFLMMYVATKSTLPMDMDFMYTDTLDALRPGIAIKRSFEDAVRGVDEMMADDHHLLPDQGGEEEVVYRDEESGEEENGDGEGEGEEGQVEATEPVEADEADEGDEEDESDSDSEGDAEMDDDVVLRESERGREKEEIPPEEEDEFNRELAKMATDNSEAKKVDKRALFDLSLPAKKKTEEEGGSGDPSQMKFTVLTKKGAKQQTRTVEVPSESPLAVNSRTNALQDQHEQAQLKKLVLDYEKRDAAQQDVNEKKRWEQLSKATGMKINFKQDG
ncbi:hypothetical protein E3P92_01876 [Wallemia ichthyophaga]|uniref:Regulator of nonsense transcripts 2 n=1 Tax=Wallemia ichthyophaga (strain EXF-994 / CBS 113033) TaxID=1299270 RepID=R9AFN6_WALI9|nr:Regulator of nonsense transcripts 2 [Wallemia ichthyophaga EXF-994]EOR01018.1 Regulator of nonsense transcripts 2 [Wallemia ichthyophaga EXF-994]TIB14780.1 hypothetical protein E3P92_01876 [Wallemia ichthyophaga]TIB31059.1 hypothetical protein E3P84_03098 [Wallemia ichthyophaga]TIB40252.1 hypothetical protein E3P83_03041 [Wallemia ichthyophaga]